LDKFMKTCITTSWDDGHPSDFRVAELLTKYGLRGTFYVPRTAETPTISATQIRELASRFEVGGHTIRHAVLTETPDDQARREIAESKSWLEDVTGRPVTMFCPPKGKFRRGHLDMIREAGFAGARTVELMSLDWPRPTAGIMVMPTTIQAHAHGPTAYVRNFARRGAIRNFWLYMLHGRKGFLLNMVRKLLARGGVFHLWGHSWELDAHNQWGRLEEAFRLMAECRQPAMTNGEIVAGSPTPGGDKDEKPLAGPHLRAKSREVVG
jgi:peptidoglycan/xylan/chitin deacetylase (PgdA/CDA1 family)